MKEQTILNPPHNAWGIEICAERQRFINSDKHCLVLGGPGSGKTTISLIKADHEITYQKILGHQKILFLSFARSTISRVMEKARVHVEPQSRRSLEINTYHGYCWSVLQSHGYLIGLNRKIKLITPADAAAHLAEIRSQNISPDEIKRQEKDETYTLAFNEGVISFDLFAELTAKILKENPKLKKIISNRYPIIILDEFQDTNLEEWELIKELSKNSMLLALADPDQRIYEFRGADPARIRQFMDKLSPDIFNFGTENNRSPGTDIATYGNDILNGTNKTKTYSNVTVSKWSFLYRSTTYTLRSKVIAAIGRLNKSGNTWSLAILVPTKRLMLSVSDALNSSANNIPAIHHTVSIDPEGPALAARVIAFLLEKSFDQKIAMIGLVKLLQLFYRGKGGNHPTVTDLKTSNSLKNALDKAILKGSIANGSIIKSCETLIKNLDSTKFVGDPEKDWLMVRQMLKNSGCPRLEHISEQASYIRLLGKGSLLRESLATLWRKNGSYIGALETIEEAFVQEHFSAAMKVINGVVVMNMHKAKGKEFDEVILFEDQYQGRFFSANGNIDQARLNLRVSVTRARKRTTILTPQTDPSRLLY